MKYLKGIGVAVLCLTTLVGCSNPHIQEFFGSYEIVRTEEMDSKRIKQNNIAEQNQIGQKLEKNLKDYEAQGIQVSRTYASKGELITMQKIYPTESKQMLEVYESEEISQFIQQCREEQTSDIIVKSKVIDGYAVSYYNDFYGKKLKEHLTQKVVKQYLQGVEAPELTITAQTRDIKDLDYQAVVDGIKTDDFLVKEVLVEGKVDRIMLTNAYASAESSMIYVAPKYIPDDLNYIVPASVRYEIYLEDMSIQKVKVYMIKQENNPLAIEELGPIYKLQEAVDKGSDWEEGIEAIYTIISKDKQGETKGKLGNWKYTCKVMDKNNGDFPVEQNFVEIIIEP